jgi:hypothetical protein
LSTTTLLESICAFKFFKVCLMKFSALSLDAHRFVIAIYFWCISPFISMECPTLACLISVILKFTLCEISIAIPVCFLGIGLVISQPFTLSQCLFLSVRMVSYKQQFLGSSFLIQFAKQLGELSPLTFNVNIDRYVMIIVI